MDLLDTLALPKCRPSAHFDLERCIQTSISNPPGMFFDPTSENFERDELISIPAIISWVELYLVFLEACK